MINLIKIVPLEGHNIKLYFSDGMSGVMDFSYLLEAKTSLTIPLENLDFFQSSFIDFGALCWKNGLELSAESLYRKLQEKNGLYASQDVA